MTNFATFIDTGNDGADQQRGKAKQASGSGWSGWGWWSPATAASPPLTTPTPANKPDVTQIS
jgi:hypothetical protein